MDSEETGVIVHSRIEGPSLANNLLGDPSERDLFVYLPPGYESSAQRFPTVYLLHEAGASAQLVAEPRRDGPRWAPPLCDVLDPVFTRMGVEPMIVVVPDGTMRYGCSQWVDSPVSGNFESYVTRDVVGYVDRTYRTIPHASSRGVLGFSSGGLGAWHIGSRNPDVFAALAMLSGDSYLDMTHKVMLYDYLNSIWPAAPAGPLEGNDASQVAYALSAAYSPNPANAPYYVDLPVAFPSGELIDDVWQRWLEFDPIVNWRDRLDNLRQLRGILLDVGTADQYNLQWGHRILSNHLREAGIDHLATENTGNHGGRSRERQQLALQWLSVVLSRSGQ